MASEEFPNDFDIVVLGTGLTETITAAAFSRIGLKVLHLDRNDYYGGAYSNFNLEGLENWRLQNESIKSQDSTSEIPGSVDKLLQNGESTIALNNNTPAALNIKCMFHVRERTAEEQAKADVKGISSRLIFTCIEPLNGSNTDAEKAEDLSVVKSSERPSSNEPESESCPASVSEALYEGAVKEECTDPISKAPDEEAVKEKVEMQDTSSLSPGTTEAHAAAQPEVAQQPKEWTVGDIKDDWRKYCIDISPKIFYCSGDIVDLLIQSDVARYCEFRSVSRVLTVLNDHLQQVPCSRADVFSSKAVSLIEKRLMMKFLQFAVDYESSPQEYQDYKDKTFLEFLQSKKLTTNIQHYIQHAIAMVTDSELTQVGLSKTKKFLQSLGRYGNTAFLFPLYGTGELPQAFSRLSAVFGGIYCLSTTATHLITDADRKCCAVVTSRGQRINCRYIVAECSYLPSSFVMKLSHRKISRAVFITDTSLLPSANSELSLLRYSSHRDPEKPVTVLELPSTACVCPKDTFVVHLTKVSGCDDPEEDLKEVRDKLFTVEISGEQRKQLKPRILWSMYFSQDDNSQVRLAESSATNVLVTSGGGDPGVDLDFCVSEAREIFHTVCPGEEFLPKPPNPEDIILVDDTEASTDQGASEYQAKEGEGESSTQEVSPDDAIPDMEGKGEKGSGDAPEKND